MTCRATRRRLPAYVGDELAPRKARNVRLHLERCLECRSQCDRLERALAALRRVGQATADECAPEAVWRAVSGRLPIGRQPGWPRARPLWRWPVPAPLTAAVGLALAAAGVALALVLWPSSPALIGRDPIETSTRPSNEEAALAEAPPVYRPVPQPPFALENAPRAEVGWEYHALPRISRRDEAPGEEFVLEQVIYRPGEERLMPF